jgi:CRP-like cAMP-binding protein
METAITVDQRSAGVKVLQAAPPNRRPDKTRFKTKVEKKQAFDAQSFLDSAGLGRKVHKFRAKETVFAQGDPAKQVMYIQEGGVKLTVVNETGKEAVVAILWTGGFLWRRVSSGPIHLHGDGDHDCTHHHAGH